MGRTRHALARARRWVLRHVFRYRYEICRDCGRRVDRTTGVFSWWAAPRDLWRRVIGTDAGILCVACFTRRARRAGVAISWRAVEE